MRRRQRWMSAALCLENMKKKTREQNNKREKYEMGTFFPEGLVI